MTFGNKQNTQTVNCFNTDTDKLQEIFTLPTKDKIVRDVANIWDKGILN